MLRDAPPFCPEDRIRELCRKALTAKDTELEVIFEELRAALHEHIERLRKIAITQLARKESPVKTGPPDPAP
jgi:outer membrane lipopolysaccharide assembly protein LptE/RlpB